MHFPVYTERKPKKGFSNMAPKVVLTRSLYWSCNTYVSESQYNLGNTEYKHWILNTSVNTYQHFMNVLVCIDPSMHTNTNGENH